MEKNGKGVFQQENTRLSGWTCPSCILCVKMGLGCCFRQALGIVRAYVGLEGIMSLMQLVMGQFPGFH